MKVLGINGGNGIIIHPLKRYLIGNVEARPVFKTRNDVQWKMNFNDIPLVNDLEEVVNTFPSTDVIVGAPNCGHSSMLAYSRAKQLSDPLKDPSFELYMVSLNYYKPKVFMMENLPKTLDMIPREIWEKSFPDYELIFHVGSVSRWGNSQLTRIRLVLIGLKREAFGDNLEEAQYHFNNVYRVNELKTSGELIKNCGIASGHYRENINDTITLYAGYKDSLRNIRNFWINNPKLKRYPVYDRKFSTAPGVYRNLKDGYPATARKANRQFSHKGLQMSPRELARIQGVPDLFEIHIDTNELTYWINKGRTTVTKCPPYEIGLWFKKQLIKAKALWK